ncbi:MAG: FAD-binding protein, partial [Betaproteobacteria bacterium]|nr:FAD-binding protein [Betaproteobacteria bacterium]
IANTAACPNPQPCLRPRYTAVSGYCPQTLVPRAFPASVSLASVKLGFEAYGVTCGITFTFGGLKITTKAQVVDTEEKPIPGLYAAGELVGGIFYFNYPGGSGLMNGAVFGRVAGENAARYAVRR